MKISINILIALLYATICLGQDPFEKGNEAYLDARYDEALNLYEETLKQDPDNISALYNLGMTNVQLKNYGEAIWAFESVLQRNPADEQAEEQIIYLYNELGAISEWQHILGPFERALFSLSSRTWAILSILLSMIGSLLIILNLIKKQMIQKKYVALLSISCFTLMIVTGYVAYKVQAFETGNKYAIVTADQIESYLKMDMSAKGPQLVMGNRLRIISEDSTSNMIEVQDVNNNIYYVQSEDIKRL